MNFQLVNITLPAHNAAHVLAGAVMRLDRFLTARAAPAGETLICNNGSTDATLEIAHRLAREHDNIRVLHLDQKGRGRALKQAWLSSDSDILSYMDVDLSSDLNSFPALIAPLVNGEFDLAVGSRLVRPKTTK